MKKVVLIGIMLVVVVSYALLSSGEEKVTPTKAIARVLLTQIDDLSFFLKDQFQTAAESNSPNEKELQQLFLQARLRYKKIEWAAEYFDAATTRSVNGPPVPEVEMGSGQVFEPAGLQIIEGYLFPRYDATKQKELVKQIKMLQYGCNKYKTYFGNIDILDGQVFDAVRLEVFRILTLGIAGFDDPLTQKSMTESAVSLESLKSVLKYYTGNDEASKKLISQISAATVYLQTHTGFDNFNRAEFITRYGNPISRSISDLEQHLKIHVIRYNRLLRQDAKTLFDPNAFDVNAYVPNADAVSTPQKVMLGKMLFSDPILSGTKTRSCRSCHQPEKAFADGLIKNTVIGTKQPLKRNTPTLLNAGLQPSQFYDLRATRLEDQVSNVVQNPDEMHGSMATAAERLWQNKIYRQLFVKAYPVEKRAAIDTLEVMNALGSYVRSLTALNSRFDAYMRGDSKAMNKDELHGFNLFMGKAKCGTCHYMPLFNGNLPPRFIKMESEVIGVPQSATAHVIDDDLGRFNIIQTPSFKHAFKVTTVRNASRTAPYMHNGVFKTLDEVMDFYNKGGGTGLGIKIDNQTLPFDKLNLSAKESKDIIAFIKSLDSR
ncbi:cytochrome-c peroxidase [Mucilaginibacter lappiensis]|uniref:Cytochrome c peroxidase n=1 Tax=Mucilaginibacter lappiensis TaxID=354630 RepID=A0A841JFS8_9SPHI|nr:cytochrome c peroxidase [Mucilaginibacter lappiensis]MBB6129720.1 cytochrome c peroxidase [Mucilaginibacter lappiensis]